MLLTSSGQEWPFHITDTIAISHDWHLAGEEWQFHIATDI